MNEATITIHTGQDIKRSAAAFFKQNGLTLESGLQLYLKSLHVDKEPGVVFSEVLRKDLTPKQLEASEKLDIEGYDEFLTL